MPYPPWARPVLEVTMAELMASDEALICGFLDYMVLAKGRSDRTREVYGLALARLREFMAPRSVLEADGSQLTLTGYLPDGTKLHETVVKKGE